MRKRSVSSLLVALMLQGCVTPSPGPSEVEEKRPVSEAPEPTLRACYDADVAYLGGDRKAAQKAYESWASKNEAAVPLASLRLGWLALSAGWLDAATQHFERAGNTPRLELDAAFGLAVASYRKERWTEALERLEALVDQLPHDRLPADRIYYLAASSARRAGLESRAKDHLALLLKKTPRSDLRRAAETMIAYPGRGFVVQAGAFAEKKNARRLRDRLARAGFETSVVSEEGSRRTLYKVWVGEFSTQAQAEKTCARVAETFAPQAIVVP